ncbi:MAG: hypothetical protein U9N62_04560 [Thermotogota bacterium]|nr:hypothetical protein [Thermotogota bacterium]
MKKVILICLFIAITTLLLGNSFKGYVYLDENKNGVLDPGEIGIQDVVVSNGLSQR